MTPAIKNVLKRKRNLCRKLDKIFKATGNKESPDYKQVKSEVNCLEIMAINATSHLFQENFKTRLTNIRKDFNMFSNIKTALGAKSFEKSQPCISVRGISYLHAQLQFVAYLIQMT